MQDAIAIDQPMNSADHIQIKISEAAATTANGFDAASGERNK
jgi:hypothetical protein